MNSLDVVVTKILVVPHRVITDDLCCWEMTVEADCYGKRIEVVRKCSKKEIDAVKIGDIIARI